MNKQMEAMISKDLGMDINKIRKSSWKELDKTVNKEKGKAFRPKNVFIVGGNINLAENREMGLFAITLRNFYREVVYKCKCLMKGKKTI